jgi:hypothetical protein
MLLSRIHIIAIPAHRIISRELEGYVHDNDKIYLYHHEWEFEFTWEYASKIIDIAKQVDEEKLEWCDLWINDGDIIERKGQDLLIAKQQVPPFTKLSKEKFANVGLITSKIYNEFLRSKEVEEKEVKDFLKESFENGIFARYITDILEESFTGNVVVEQLNNLDKQIIVRTKIEGFRFITNFAKNILKSKVKNKIELCNLFFGRVFMLETQNYINL